MFFASFTYKYVFRNKVGIINYYDSCIYNWVKSSKILDYQLYNVTLILLIKYQKKLNL